MASDIFAPVSGEVVESNAILATRPEAINDDAFGTWFVVHPHERPPDRWRMLMDAKAYEAFCAHS